MNVWLIEPDQPTNENVFYQYDKWEIGESEIVVKSDSKMMIHIITIIINLVVISIYVIIYNIEFNNNNKQTQQ